MTLYREYLANLKKSHTSFDFSTTRFYCNICFLWSVLQSCPFCVLLLSFYQQIYHICLLLFIKFVTFAIVVHYICSTSRFVFIFSINSTFYFCCFSLPFPLCLVLTLFSGIWVTTNYIPSARNLFKALLL